jgi:hypothetical protein
MVPIVFKDYTALESIKEQVDGYMSIFEQLLKTLIANSYLEETSGRYNIESFKSDVRRIITDRAKK